MKSLFTIAIAFVAMSFTTEASAQSCQADLKRGNGRVLETFVRSGYNRQDACRYALRDCNRAMRNGRHRRGNLRCETIRGGNQNRNPIITKRCDAKLLDNYGRFIQGFWKTETGRLGSGVKNRACSNAKMMCENFKRQRGYWNAHCRTDLESTPIPTPPRRGGRRGNR